MARPAIVVENLGKQYQIGLREAARKNFREALAGMAAAPLERFRRLAGRVDEAETFWALRDVSFEVQPGEVVGIIGRNGAGKSTLLKILSQITEPTTGYARIRGRIAALLEVGTGFHPELTGRENVYLNGSILGMSKREIERKFDEIVDFAGVEKFIDTPVKRYSSGMKVRLGFAVAAHLEPEILIVDEVLAVGDAEFQQKCLGKMNAVADSGRTVLFVSHNMAAVESLCTRAIVLRSGSRAFQGGVDSAIATYLNSPQRSGGDLDLSDQPRPIGASPIIRRVRILSPDGIPFDYIPTGADVVFEFTLDPPEPVYAARLIAVIAGPRGERLFSLHTRFQYKNNLHISGQTTVSCTVRNLRLVPGRYHVRVLLKSNWDVLDELPEFSLDVGAADLYGTGILPLPRHGLVLPDVDWRFEQVPNAVLH